MRLLVMGDFSGRAADDRPPLAGRPTHHVDVDNIDDVVERLGPRVMLSGGGIHFAQIDDFHPDRLYARLDSFQALREARAAPPRDTDELLVRLLGKPTAPSAAPASVPSDALDALIRGIVAPHVVKDTSGQTRSYLAAVDAAIAEQMRLLLHDPAFQSLEAAWRGVKWLISSLELDENLQLHLFDVARDEIVADLVPAEGRISQTNLYRAVVDRWRNVPGAQGWSALVALIQFGPSDEDAGLLGSLGAIASEAGAPLLAGADLALAGDDAAGLEGWHALRQSEGARRIALAAPRVLLRLPYGKDTEPLDAFAFEEFTGLPVHDEFLWGSPALAMTLLIGRAFTARGRDMEPGDEREIDGLPAYTFVRHGEHELQACAERYLTESELLALLKAGIVPLASRRDRNVVVAIRFQSIADPPAPLIF
jgi:type VI secretion system protein ImpC